MPTPNPAGGSVAEHLTAALDDAEFRGEYERLALCEHVARVVIARRATLGLSQQDLADRLGTTVAAVSRVESGQHASSLHTLKRVAEALDLRLVIGFEETSAPQADRGLMPISINQLPAFLRGLLDPETKGLTPEEEAVVRQVEENVRRLVAR